MVRRASSPALSENDFDITDALFQNGRSGKREDLGAFLSDEGEEEDFLAQSSARSKLPPKNEILNLEADLAGDANKSEDEDADGDEAFIAARQAASNRKASMLKGKTVKKGGGFQAMGLDPALLKAITRKGFSVPTPIQRKAIPLVLDRQDVVGMARTGSGKTAAFVIPMIQRLKAHSVKVGARGVILSPSRELALQTLKVVKELGRGTDLRTILLVGGDSMEEQFSSMASNPDIIIATPGRFLHLKVEMNLDLSSVKYIVFDEADRLFEMGFAAQLAEIIHALPTSRQTLLFSATLPKSLVEFARAGLQEPKLIRLDAESKVSPDLESAFFAVKTEEKEGALLHIIQDIIKIPVGPTEAAVNGKRSKGDDKKSKKRKRTSAEDGPNASSDSPTQHSTIIFTATKHHVDYITELLRSVGYACSHVYGSLDQTARKMQVADFRSGLSNILVVTDVAARGIDIPILANVINYDFPPQPKVFVHRVGRTARAGRRGWSYSLVRDGDIPYMLDLQLFLSRRLVVGRNGPASFAEDIIFGPVLREQLEKSCELVNRLLSDDEDLQGLRSVAIKGEKLFMRTRNSASAQSVKRAREVITSPGFSEPNLLFDDASNDLSMARERLLAQISGFKPAETVFEIGKRGGAGDEAAEIMRQRRAKLDTTRARRAAAAAKESRVTNGDEPNGAKAIVAADDAAPSADAPASFGGEDDDLDLAYVDASMDLDNDNDNDDDDDDEFEITVSETQPGNSRKGKTSNPTNGGWQDDEHFMSYAPKSINLVEDRGYGVQSGSNDTSRSFLEAARGATMDLTNDENSGFLEAARAGNRMRWDKKSKKYVSRSNDQDGSRQGQVKMVRGESGLRIAASFKSGRFDAWKKSNKLDRLPRVGETESAGAARRHAAAMAGPEGSGSSHIGGRRFHHKSEKAPKEADRFRDDYHVRKQRVQEAREKGIGRFKDSGPAGGGAAGRVGAKRVKSELKSVEEVRKERKQQENKRDKNGRPARKKF